jgi:hypothetical protein
LLQSINAQQNTYNWNPLLFGFTAGIGVLALGFTIMTIFLSVLAAGPGRLKASRTAIGLWERRKRLVPDWRELRLRTIASTPFLTREGIINALPGHNEKPQEKETSTTKVPFQFPKFLQPAAKIKESDVEDMENEHSGKTVHQRSSKDVKKLVKRAKTGSVLPPASWFYVLTRLGLENLDYQLVPTLADYLPSDVQAVPAYGDVETICTLALLAGGRTISLDGKYPRVTGPGLQLSFRDHPSLGTVAVFENYVKSSSYRYISPFDVRYVLGYKFDTEFRLWWIKSSRDALMRFSEPPYPYSLVTEFPFPGLPKCSSHAWCAAQSGYCNPNTAIALILSKPIPFIPVFPTTNSRVHMWASALAAQSKVWSLSLASSRDWNIGANFGLCLSSTGDQKPMSSKEPSPQRVADRLAFVLLPALASEVEWEKINGLDDTFRKGIQFCNDPTRPPWSEIDIPNLHKRLELPDTHLTWRANPAENELVILQIAYIACHAWLNGNLLGKSGVKDQWYAENLSTQTETEEGIATLRILLSLQIQELDWWFWQKEARLSSCRVGVLTTIALWCMLYHEDSLTSTALPRWNNLPKWSDPEWTPSILNDTIRTMVDTILTHEIYPRESGERHFFSQSAIAEHVQELRELWLKPDTGIGETYRSSAHYHIQHGAIEDLDNFLIFRALCQALLLSLAADNSVLKGLPVGKQIVPFL